MALPGVPHQQCHFHYLREAAKPISEADRHAKKELKKRVRGVRPIERKVEGRTAPLEAPLADHSKHPEEKTEQGEELEDGQRPVPVGAEGEWSPEEEREEDDAAEMVETLDCRASPTAGTAAEYSAARSGSAAD